MHASAVVAVFINLRNQDRKCLADLRWLNADNSLPPCRTEIQSISGIGFAWQVDAMNRRESPIGERHQGSISNFRIAAGGRKGAVAHPLIHVGDHGAPEELDWQRRLRLLA